MRECRSQVNQIENDLGGLVDRVDAATEGFVGSASKKAQQSGRVSTKEATAYYKDGVLLGICPRGAKEIVASEETQEMKFDAKKRGLQINVVEKSVLDSFAKQIHYNADNPVADINSSKKAWLGSGDSIDIADLIKEAVKSDDNLMGQLQSVAQKLQSEGLDLQDAGKEAEKQFDPYQESVGKYILDNVYNTIDAKYLMQDLLEMAGFKAPEITEDI
jgi:hypothetical protein